VDDYITKCFAGGVFLNFCINRDVLFKTVIPQILTLQGDYGSNASGFGKSAVVEYSSPNIAKPFHAGHLRSTIIGNFVRNVLNKCGWKTIAINYLGDWGKQYGK
jgi:arginyl-tRNA synthetase